MRLKRYTLLPIILVSFIGIFGTQSTQAQLADSPWPSFGNDAQNSGLSEYEGAQTDSLKWRYEAGGDINSSPAIGNDGTIYFEAPGEYGDYLYAINPDGTQKWQYEMDINGSSPTIGSDGTIYVGSENDSLYAINPDGTTKWRYRVGFSTPISTAPVIDSSGTIYVASNSKVHAINPDGTQKWEYLETGSGNSSPAIGNDGTIYIGSTDEHLHAINPDGSQKWLFDANSFIESSPAIGNNGTIYVGAYDSTLYAINPDGTLKWKYGTPDRPASPSISSQGTIYFGAHDSLYALNSDGTLKWKYGTENSLESPPVIDSNGTIYVGSSDTYLYAINTDGTLKWRYKTSGRIYKSAAIGSNGTIYIGTSFKYLYAIGGSEATDITDKTTLPNSYSISANYPNPFNPTTNIKFNLPKSSNVTLTVYNAIGKKVTKVVDKKMNAGSHTITFNGKGLPSGMYIYRLNAGAYTESKKMVLMK